MTSTSGPLRPSRNRPAPLRRLYPSAPDLRVSGVSIDSRSVFAGDLYVGLPGNLTHGARFATAAAQAGAVAVLTDALDAQERDLARLREQQDFTERLLSARAERTDRALPKTPRD